MVLLKIFPGEKFLTALEVLFYLNLKRVNICLCQSNPSLLKGGKERDILLPLSPLLLYGFVALYSDNNI